MYSSSAVKHGSFPGVEEVLKQIKDFFLQALLSCWVGEELMVGTVHRNESMFESVMLACFFDILGYLLQALDCDNICDTEHFF